MSTHDDDQLVADYLRRLDAAASALPFDRRAELIDEITAHIAEARAAGPVAFGGGPGTRNILERLGDPADIVRAAAESAPDHAADGVPGQSGSNSPAVREETDFGNSLISGPADGIWSVSGGAEPGGAGLGGAGPGSEGPGSEGPSAGGHLGALEICAVVLLLIGGIIVPFLGWVVGVILLWISPRWSRGDKWLGTLVWPGGLLAPVVALGIGGLATLTVASSGRCPANVSGQPAPVAQHAGSTGSASVHAGHAARHAAVACSPAGSPNWLAIAIALIVLAAAIGGPIYTAVRLVRRARQEAPRSPAQSPALIPV